MDVVLVEDDPLLGERLRARLCQDGYAVDWARDRIAAEQAILAKANALVVLDLGLARHAGYALLAGLRHAHEHMPILAIAARGPLPDCVTGLELGADDCLAWPFHLDELAARVRALLRRHSGAQAPASTRPPHVP